MIRAHVARARNLSSVTASSPNAKLKRRRATALTRAGGWNGGRLEHQLARFTALL